MKYNSPKQPHGEWIIDKTKLDIYVNGTNIHFWEHVELRISFVPGGMSIMVREPGK